MAGWWQSCKCGAKTRKGVPCIAQAMKNGRCRNHGGMCTGPRTSCDLSGPTAIEKFCREDRPTALIQLLVREARRTA